MYSAVSLNFTSLNFTIPFQFDQEFVPNIDYPKDFFSDFLAVDRGQPTIGEFDFFNF